MSAPKFQVGEVVIFNSPDWPADGYGYDLGFSVPEGSPSGVAIWDECILRKRHLPGEMSFLDLMASLSNPRLESVEVSHA
ncbi:hypothetical protein D9M68_693020 [compost metagenome]